MRRKTAHFLTWLAFLCQGPLVAQQRSAINFLIVKYGDESATQEMAGDFLASLAHYLNANVGAFKDKEVRGWIANTPDSAAAKMRQQQPAIALVPPGFYLEHFYGMEPKIEPILQIPRFTTDVEKYYLVTTKKGPESLKDLKNRIVATQFAIDLAYLKKVVFPRDFRPGTDFKIKKSDNLADDLFLLIEEGGDEFNTDAMSNPSAVLLDEELKTFFQEDEFVWPEIIILWTSESLPRDLVIVSDLPQPVIDQVRTALLKMPGDDTGKNLLNLMQSSGFSEIDWDLLNKTTNKYLTRP